MGHKLLIGLMVLLGVVAATTGSAFAAFEARETKESSVKLESKESGITFKFAEKEKKAEVTCEVSKAEGAVMGRNGANGGSESLDEAASEPGGISDQMALTKIKLESCKGNIGGVESSTINTETCQLELWDESETEGKAEATFSLHAVKNEKPCTLKTVASKCTVEFRTTEEGENEELKGVKLRNKAVFETEIESGSEVKGIKAKASSECKIGESPEATLVFKKALTLKGVQLVSPTVTVSVEGGTKADGKTFDFPNTEVGKTARMIVTWTAKANNTKFSTITLTNTVAGIFSKGIDNCSGNTFNNAGSCTVEYKFAPAATINYTAFSLTPFKVGFWSWGDTIRDGYVGKGI